MHAAHVSTSRGDFIVRPNIESSCIGMNGQKTSGQLHLPSDSDREIGRMNPEVFRPTILQHTTREADSNQIGSNIFFLSQYPRILVSL